jgi:hypothetical protein
MAINDWCDKNNKPEIHFPASFVNFCICIYNLRISYQSQEISLVNNDVSGDFCHAKYIPNLVALHACLLFGYLFMSTGQTFGDCPSPGNFEPIARARQQYVQFLWNQTSTPSLAHPYYLPVLQFQEPPTDPSDFTQSLPNCLNGGVFNSGGSCKKTRLTTTSAITFMAISRSIPRSVSASVSCLCIFYLANAALTTLTWSLGTS